MGQITNHKITIEYLKLLFVKSRSSKLEFELGKDVDNAFKYLSGLFNLSHIQCALLSIVFNFTIDEDLERVKTDRLLSFLGLDLEVFYDIKGDIEVLINRGFIKQKKEDRSNNLFNSSFVVNQKLLDMLFRNEEIQFGVLFGNGYSFIQFCGQQYRVCNRKLLSHLSREEVLNEISEQENKNENLTQIQTMKSLGLQVKDRLFMYYIIHRYKDGNENAVSAYTIGFDVLGPAKVLSFIHKLKNKNTQMQVQGLVELVGDNELQLTDKAKELLLNDVTNTVEEGQSEVSTTHYFTKHDSIPERRLYFNSDIQRELNILQTLLQKDNFDEYQQAMRLKGNHNIGLSVLLYGPSGGGKTSIANTISRYTKRDILQVDLSQVRAKWYGDSEKNIKKIFVDYQAKCKISDNTPILLLDECDAILGKRSNTGEKHDQTEAVMTNQLLEQFEKNNGIILGITNLVENLDPAFMRRFTMKYYIGNPDQKAVKSILKSKLDFLNEKEIGWIADRHLLTGGQIENISQKCVISRIITKSNPTVHEILEYCENEKIKSNPWKNIKYE